MMSGGENLVSKWIPQPVKRRGLEIVLMRFGFAVLLWLRLPAGIGTASQPTPNGMAHWLELTFLANPAVFGPLRWIFLGMLVLYVSGRGLALALSYLCAVYLAVFTLGNSQGWIGHTDQIVALILLVQTVLHFFVFFRKRTGRGKFSVADLEVFYTQQTIAAAYMVAGLTKLIKTSGLWVAQLPNITVQIVKTNDQFYYDSLAHPYPGLADWLNTTIIQHPWIAYPMFAPGLLVELAAIVIPFGRKPAFIMGFILLAMHALISLVMQISFTTYIALILIYLINVPGLLAKVLPPGKRAGRGADK